MNELLVSTPVKHDISQITQSWNDSRQRKYSMHECKLHKTPHATFAEDELETDPAEKDNIVKLPLVLCVVGLPARGKTRMTTKLSRYLNWSGFKTQVFNEAEYQTSFGSKSALDLDYGEFKTMERDEQEQLFTDCCRFLEEENGDIIILNGRNTAKESRRQIVDMFSKHYCSRVLFIESITDDDTLQGNIQEILQDACFGQEADPVPQEQVERFAELSRLDYETLDPMADDDLSFIKVINFGTSFLVQNIKGHLMSRVVYFLMNIHLRPRTIYLSRHGESEYNRLGRLGGDSPLSHRGLIYGKKLAEYFEEVEVPGLQVWCSQKIRAVQTASFLSRFTACIESWKDLNELDGGICDGLTYDEIKARYPEQFLARKNDKYNYRYPSGESYKDLIDRLEPVIIELERSHNVLVVSHQAVLRCLLAYFLNKSREELPYLPVPSHALIKLVPTTSDCKMEVVKFDI